MATSVTHIAKLETRFRRVGREWLACCPALDVMTQARTKKKALESLREAVELWFESCIERGVLDKALNEAGFSVGWAKTEAEVPAEAKNLVVTVMEQPGRSDAPASTTRPRHLRGQDFIQVSIPAYIAAQQLAGSIHAAY